MKTRRILITGGTGQLGTELLRCQWPDDFQLVAPSRAELDLSKCDAIGHYVRNGGFSAVINCGAYTAVDRAESDVVTTWKVNALGPAALATATKDVGVPIIHLSTDYVFDGSKHGPYREDDPVAPLGVYGASKEAGEQAVRTGNPLHVILRTAWVFSARGSNFFKTMLRLSNERELIKVVNDQLGCPTAASDIASAVKLVVFHLLEANGKCLGTYHFANSGQSTWYGFARELFAQCELRGYSVPKLQPIETKEYPTAARRPANSRLSLDKLFQDYDIKPRKWEDALADTLVTWFSMQGKDL